MNFKNVVLALWKSEDYKYAEAETFETYSILKTWNKF